MNKNTNYARVGNIAGHSCYGFVKKEVIVKKEEYRKPMFKEDDKLESILSPPKTTFVNIDYTWHLVSIGDRVHGLVEPNTKCGVNLALKERILTSTRVASSENICEVCLLNISIENTDTKT